MRRGEPLDRLIGSLLVVYATELSGTRRVCSGWRGVRFQHHRLLAEVTVLATKPSETSGSERLLPRSRDGSAYTRIWSEAEIKAETPPIPPWS